MAQTTRLKIAGMTCVNCVVHVEKALQAVPGVSDVTVALEKGATVEHDGADTQLLVHAVEAAGDYKAEVIR